MGDELGDESGEQRKSAVTIGNGADCQMRREDDGSRYVVSGSLAYRVDQLRPHGPLVFRAPEEQAELREKENAQRHPI